MTRNDSRVAAAATLIFGIVAVCGFAFELPVLGIAAFTVTLAAVLMRIEWLADQLGWFEAAATRRIESNSRFLLKQRKELGRQIGNVGDRVDRLEGRVSNAETCVHGTQERCASLDHSAALQIAELTGRVHDLETLARNRVRAGLRTWSGTASGPCPIMWSRSRARWRSSWLGPHEPRLETVNDKDCYLANFWRAVSANPDAVAEWADSPVNEADLHARHRWLVDQSEFRDSMRRDPHYYDAKIAGWWVWGISLWIGSGWCSRPDWQGRAHAGRGPRGIFAKKPRTDRNGTSGSVHGLYRKRPVITGPRASAAHGASPSRRSVRAAAARPIGCAGRVTSG